MSLLNNLFGSGAQHAAQGFQNTSQHGHNIAHSLQGGQWSTSTSGQNAAQQQQYNNILAQNTTLSGKITGETHVPVTSKEIEHEAYNVAVDALIDLWVTRYGNEWVDLSEIESDEFFRLAYRRLKQMGELETHYLTDRARYVCRRPK